MLNAGYKINKMEKISFLFFKPAFVIIIIGLCAAFCNRRNNPQATSSKQAGRWETGVALYSFNKYSFVTTLDKADSSGARSVEGFFFHNMGKEFNNKKMVAISWQDAVMMKQMLDKKGIRMNSMYIGDAKNVNEWKMFFDVAKLCEMKFLVCEPKKQDWDVLDSLAGVYNIKIAIHEHSKQKSMYWHPDSVLAAMKGHPNFGACADLGHWVRSGLDPVECLQKLNGHILGVHLKDIDEAGNDNAKDVLVGTGVIDFPAVVHELKKQHFDGTVNVECEHDMDNNLSDVTKSLRYFNDLSNKN
jgi:sugar phosphate isomerase/epimerase